MTSVGKVFPELDAELQRWIVRQHVFFVASAPLSASGHVNLSPKGLDSFRVLSPRRVAYLDLTGSGAETAAHLRENGRIALMFCAFEGPPRVVRLHGRGRVSSVASMREHFPPLPGERAVIVVDLERISDSCGYGVPLMSFLGERPQLAAWVDRKDRGEGLDHYRSVNNAVSIDGLPSIASEEF